jgi:hypothetical protein
MMKENKATLNWIFIFINDVSYKHLMTLQKSYKEIEEMSFI